MDHIANSLLKIGLIKYSIRFSQLLLVSTMNASLLKKFLMLFLSHTFTSLLDNRPHIFTPSFHFHSLISSWSKISETFENFRNLSGVELRVLLFIFSTPCPQTI